jgi:polyferredoxin
MRKMGYPAGLIRYSTENALTQLQRGRSVWRQVFRPRIVVYGALLVIITGLFAGGLYLRSPLKVDVIRDRGALFRETREGLVENVYRLQLMNTAERTRRITVTASGLESLTVVAPPVIEVPAATTQAVAVALRVDPARVAGGSYTVVFHVQDADEPRVRVDEKSRFLLR